MKIFYGVQGTGNGHLSRARMMAKHFRNYPNVEVQFLFSGRDPDKYFDMEIFGDYITRKGLTFSTNKGKINIFDTLKNVSWCTFVKDVFSLDLSDYDLVISDYEPITSWAAKKADVRLLAIGHQSAFAYDIPVVGDNFITRAIMRNFAPADMHIGLHWWHYDQPILPPIIDTALSNEDTQTPFVLVYLPFENKMDILDALYILCNADWKRRFVCYGNVQSHEIYLDGAIEFRPVSYQGFHQALKQCSAVICNAGFELNSEALHLGKPLMVKAVEGQMEQMSNAHTLVDLGFGESIDNLRWYNIDLWLTQLEKRPSPQCKWPDVSYGIVEWIMQGCDLDNYRELCDTLWKQVDVRDNP